MLKFDTLWDFFFQYSNTKTTSLPKISFFRVKIGGEILECLCSDDSIACIAGIFIGYASVFVCVKSPCWNHGYIDLQKSGEVKESGRGLHWLLLFAPLSTPWVLKLKNQDGNYTYRVTNINKEVSLPLKKFVCKKNAPALKAHDFRYKPFL